MSAAEAPRPVRTTGASSVGSVASASATPLESAPLSRTAHEPSAVDISPTTKDDTDAGSVRSRNVGSTKDSVAEQFRHWSMIVVLNCRLKSVMAPPGSANTWAPASSPSYWLAST